MKRITHYRRFGANWIIFPQMSLKAVVRFLLLGAFSELRVEDEGGVAVIISLIEDNNNERQKLLTLLA